MVRGKLQIAPVLVVLLLVATTLVQETRAASLENSIPVTYRSQETGYYCGPAVVQMALSYVAADLQSQNTLASEMETDPVEGVTYANMMRVPFENRGFQEVYEGTLELEDLREANDNDYLTIILIFFSTARVYQHYVLVIGYNSSGICAHDPWPLNSSQPEGRFTGANAFISNELLADLWACDPPHWGLVIPYSNALGEVPSWWQQHWYLLIAIPVFVAAISVIVLMKKKKAATKNPDAGMEV
jgi:predicted double-glycine peptidase